MEAYTLWPALATVMAVSRPIPELQPVIKTPLLLLSILVSLRRG